MDLEPVLNGNVVDTAGAGDWTATHQMSLNGKFDGITRADLLALALANSIKDASAVIDEVREVAARWPEMARGCGVPEEMVKKIKANMLLDI